MADPDIQMPDGSTSEGWLFTLQAAMAVDVDLMKVSSMRAIETLSPGSPWRPTALSLLGCAELWRGDLEASEAHLMKAAEVGASLGANAAAATALAAWAELELRHENWTRAQALVNEALATVEKHHLTSYVTSAFTFAVAGFCAIRKGERATASKFLELAQSALPETGLGLGLLGTQSRLVLVRIHLAMGEAGTAAAALKEIERLVPVGASQGTLATEVEGLASQLSSLDDEVSASLRITPAEMRLLPLLTTAYPLREIANQMHLSVHTVKSQAASIYRKLGVASRAHAVERAIALGLVPGEPQLGAHYSSELVEPDRNRPRPPSAR
jgi:LuxR family maltose regulon positive regulatory protein